MPKTRTRIVLEASEKIITFEQLIKNITSQKACEISNDWDIATEILKTLRTEKKIKAKDYKFRIEKLKEKYPKVDQNKYYGVLGKLKRAGLIGKKEGEYFLSDALALRCTEMAEIWRAFCEEKISQ